MKTGWIFLLDLLLDGVMVTLALRLGGLKASVWKIGLAALAGAAAARLCAGLPKGMRAALWLPIAAGMMRIAAGRAEKPLRAAGLLLAAAGLLGGTVQALSGAAGSRTIGLWLGAAAAPLLSVATVRLRRMRQGATHVRVRMTCGGRTAAFTAMVDSGNCLRDYLTHRPVIVMPQARGYRLFGLENTPLRPIFADTAGGRQMMLCLTPEATILDNGQTKRAVEALLALSPGLGGERSGSAAGFAARGRTRGGLNMEKRKCKSSWGWRAHRPPMTLLRTEGTVAYIGGSDTLPAPLSREEEQALFLNMEAQPETARRTLIEHNLRLVVYIARKFENTGVGIEDLISIGTIGLIKAVKTFDPHKKIKLATYASRCIENEILMFLRRTSRQKLEVSLDEPLNTDWDGNELLLSDILGTEGDMVYRSIEETVERQMLARALSKLSAREKEIMRLRFGLGGCAEKTQKQVADIMGISQSYISRLEKRILNRLQKDMTQMG